MAATLKFIGLDDDSLDVAQRAEVTQLAQKHATKLGQIVHNDAVVTVQLKVGDKTGERKRYAVHVRMTFPGGGFVAEKEEWVLNKAVREAFIGVEHQLEHRFQEKR